MPVDRARSAPGCARWRSVPPRQPARGSQLKCDGGGMLDRPRHPPVAPGPVPEVIDVPIDRTRLVHPQRGQKDDAIGEVDPGGPCSHALPPSLRHRSTGRGFCVGACRNREPCRVATASNEQARTTIAPKVPNVWDSGNSWLMVIDRSAADSTRVPRRQISSDASRSTRPRSGDHSRGQRGTLRV
jgi:hypothetical protein